MRLVTQSVEQLRRVGSHVASAGEATHGHQLANHGQVPCEIDTEHAKANDHPNQQREGPEESSPAIVVAI